jgi:hypothetical protein
VKRDEAFNTLRRLLDEFEAATFAVTYVLGAWNDSSDLIIAAKAGGVTDGNVRRCARNLEFTFVLRQFAEFEAILRDFWKVGLKRATRPEMERLMNSIARRRRMSPEDLVAAHEVREYRNQVIHENLRTTLLDFHSCQRALGKYLRWLPVKW